MEIDLVALCLSAGAELMLADVNGLDTATSFTLLLKPSTVNCI